LIARMINLIIRAINPEERGEDDEHRRATALARRTR
jgi:hypothetical protein